jgi:hypothetical protein
VALLNAPEKDAPRGAGAGDPNGAGVAPNGAGVAPNGAGVAPNAPGEGAPKGALAPNPPEVPKGAGATGAGVEPNAGVKLEAPNEKAPGVGAPAAPLDPPKVNAIAAWECVDVKSRPVTFLLMRIDG